jgi:hypothetical protein
MTISIVASFFLILILGLAFAESAEPTVLFSGVKKRGTDLWSGSALNRLDGSARGYCSRHVDETVYLSVLFPGTRSFEGPRFRSVSCSQRGDGMRPIEISASFHPLESAAKQRLLPWSLPNLVRKTVLFFVLFHR